MRQIVEPGTVVVRAAGRIEGIPYRWAIVAMFGFSSTLNYLDRQILGAVAPSLKQEFFLSNAEYGLLISAFSISYMICTPLAGLFIDWIGLRVGPALAVTAWSLVGVLTGFVRGFPSLFVARVGLGIAEASGIPSSSKASATYLKPAEIGLGNAIQSVDITLGAIAAPLIAAAIVPSYGWRGAFVICGLLGFLWVPLWWWTSRATVSSSTALPAKSLRISEVLFDKRLWSVIVASAFIMTVHSLWMNWTTVFLVQEWRLSQTEANRYFAWVPPIFASLGGIAGGALGFRFVRRSSSTVNGRLKACYVAAPLIVFAAVAPFLPSVTFSLAAICVSFFGCMMVLINLHVVPIDLFGANRTAFATALLTSSYALMQAILSPAIGAMIDRSGFQVVCALTAVLSLFGVLILHFTIGRKQERSRHNS